MSEYNKVVDKLAENFYDWAAKDIETPKMEKKLFPYSSIFSPLKINNLTVKNRYVMAPMGNVSMCEETGKPNEQMIAYFEERASGGVGLITTGLIPVSYGIDHTILEKGDLVYFPRIDRSRTVLAGWRDLTSRCHAHGAKVFIQLSAGLGRVGNPQCLVNRLKFPKSASFNPNFYISAIPCLRMSDRQITKIIKNIGQASADSKAVNLDGIYLHGHEGYLIEQLTNTAFNHRVLGKYSNWQRFGIDMIKEIRARVGDNFPIMYRIDLSLMLNQTYGKKMDEVRSLKGFKKERTIEESLDYMAALVGAGVDLFDVDLGCYDNWWLPHPPASMPPAPYIELANLTKQYFKEKGILTNKGQEVAVVAVGKIGYPDVAEQALRDKKCDMVMLGRPLLADPELPNKVYRGDVDTIVPCIGCQEACINEFVEAGHPQCAVNPRCAFENVFPKNPTPAPIKKNIAVIGAGPAGIISAKTLLERGHKVTLFEKSNKIGGMLIPGGSPKIKYEVNNYLIYLNNLLENLKKDKNFKFLLNTPMDKDSLRDKFEVIITACGSSQIKPNIEGVDSPNVFYGIDILNNPKLLDTFNNIIVVGGGVVGCETAQFIRFELNKKVKVLEMTEYFMNHVCTANRGHLIHSLEQGDVKLMNCTKLLKIEKNYVLVSKNVSKTVPNPYCTWAPILPENIVNPLAKKLKLSLVEEKIDADAVVLSLGSRSSDKLYYDIVKNNLAQEVYNVGDSATVGKVTEAVASAYRKCLKI